MGCFPHPCLLRAPFRFPDHALRLSDSRPLVPAFRPLAPGLSCRSVAVQEEDRNVGQEDILARKLRPLFEQLAQQIDNFTSDISNYYSAVTNGDTILYFADAEYFWVKHILIPFSDKQTADLEAYKADGNTDADVAKFREQLGRQVVVYKHVDGEDDTSRSYTIEQAYADISRTWEKTTFLPEVFICAAAYFCR